jgi:hypothetical protein
MEAFDGPLGNRRQADVTKMMDSALSSGGERQQSEVTLYRVLQTMLRHKGEISTPGDLLGENRKGAVAELASVLAGDAQAASDGGWVSANVAASPLNPSGEGDAQQIVQIENLLIAGRRGEALQAAVAAKLWPHALLLASHMGGRHYHETVSIMAKSVCRVGSPLHTLEVVMAGIPQELTTSGVEAAPKFENFSRDGASTSLFFVQTQQKGVISCSKRSATSSGVRMTSRPRMLPTHCQSNVRRRIHSIRGCVSSARIIASSRGRTSRLVPCTSPRFSNSRC